MLLRITTTLIGTLMFAVPVMAQTAPLTSNDYSPIENQVLPVLKLRFGNSGVVEQSIKVLPQTTIFNSRVDRPIAVLPDAENFDLKSSFTLDLTGETIFKAPPLMGPLGTQSSLQSSASATNDYVAAEFKQFAYLKPKSLKQSSKNQHLSTVALAKNVEATGQSTTIVVLP